jgi:2-polyprenyl-3-methyl-5-hydroxy-6-metoxy-1,4-benzoquinol methylase
MNRKERRAGKKSKKSGMVAASGLPDFAEACFSHGNLLASQGRLIEAADHYRRAIAARPDHAEAATNLGSALFELGQTEEAIDVWRRVTTVAPRHPMPHMNLGVAFAKLGRPVEAMVHYQKAWDLRPDYIEAGVSLAQTQIATGDIFAALDSARRILAVRDSDDAKQTFVYCLEQISFTSDFPAIRALVARALSEPWARPRSFAGAAADLAKRNLVLAACVSRVTKAWPTRVTGPAFWSASERSTICGDQLLLALLTSAPVCDLDLERFLTCARLTLLEDAQGPLSSRPQQDVLEFYCALARQCFINEYVFACGDDELSRIAQLRASLQETLERGADLPLLSIAAAAAYGPLHELPRSQSLSGRPWPPAVMHLLTQQIEEPLEESCIRSSIPTLTPIADAVSLAVQQQYEANPYPRWIKAPAGQAGVAIEDYVRNQCHAADVHSTPGNDGYDILVAGCGTGQQAIDISRQLRGARVLAIDLSRSSLSYAIRKTCDLKLSNIEYAQADILNLASFQRSFDVIVTAGVLHHLDDPFSGWRALLSLLRPRGLMSLGLYSELGRRAVTAARALIVQRGYNSEADDIRRFRQELAANEQNLDLGEILHSPDFFNTSGCRDLLFHVKEHRLTIPQIKAFLHASELRFVGFNVDGRVFEDFRRQFPDPNAATDLDRWHVFETNYPSVFSAMYNFWIQKPD